MTVSSCGAISKELQSVIAVIKGAGGPALTEIGQASAHRLIETELDPMCE